MRLFTQGKTRRISHRPKSILNKMQTVPILIRACVLTKTKTARINGSHLISVLDSVSSECCP